MSISMSELEKVAGRHTTRQASEVKSNWRAIVQEAKKQEVIVTNYNQPEVVVMSAERYVELTSAAKANDPLQKLFERFDAELAWLRAPGASEILDEISAMTPQQIADAVNAERRKK